MSPLLQNHFYMFLKNKKYNISSCSIFKNISDKELEILFKDTHFQLNKVEKNHYIAHRNTICNDLIILLNGKINAEINDINDKTIIVAEISAIDTLAIAFLFGDKNFYPVDIVAKESVEILRIPKDCVLKMFAINANFSENFLNSVSNRTQYLTEKIKFLSFQTIKGKYAFYLLKKAEQKKLDTIIISQTQKELSELFGVARPSLARAIKQLSDDKIIKTEKKKVTILNKQALKTLLKFESKLH